MIRGALILAIGFGLGYAKAASEQDAVRDAVLSAAEATTDALKALADDLKKKDQESGSDEVADVVDDPAPEPEVIDPDEVTDPQDEGEKP